MENLRFAGGGAAKAVTVHRLRRSVNRKARIAGEPPMQRRGDANPQVEPIALGSRYSLKFEARGGLSIREPSGSNVIVS